MVKAFWGMPYDSCKEWDRAIIFSIGIYSNIPLSEKCIYENVYCITLNREVYVSKWHTHLQMHKGTHKPGASGSRL
jgi:hypothetical protein